MNNKNIFYITMNNKLFSILYKIIMNNYFYIIMNDE